MKKRWLEIDLARSFAILCLPLIHIYEYWGSWGGMADILQDGVTASLSGLICFLTIFVAPTFMLCMGMNMVWTRNNSPQAFARRGLALLVIEFVFNLVRYVIPGLIGVAVGGVDTTDAATTLFWMVYGTINSDILAFAGLTFLLFALWRKFKWKPIVIVAASIVLFAMNEILTQFLAPLMNENCNYFFCELMGNFFYVNADSTFPLLSWLIFPSFGYLFASWLKNSDGEKLKNIWRITGIFSCSVLAVLVVVLALCGKNPIIRLNVTECNNLMDPICAVGELSASFLFLVICHAVYHLVRLDGKPRFNSFLKDYSNNITYNYMVQWTLIGWVLFITCGVHAWGSKVLNMPLTLLCVAVFTVLSYFLGRGIQKQLRSAGKSVVERGV